MCSVDGCEGRPYRRDLCHKHYRQYLARRRSSRAEQYPEEYVGASDEYVDISGACDVDTDTMPDELDESVLCDGLSLQMILYHVVGAMADDDPVPRLKALAQTLLEEL